MRAFGIIGLLIAVLIIAFVSIKELDLLSKGTNNPKQTVNYAESVKNSANLSALETKLNVYYSENGHYPSSLSEIDSYGLNLKDFEYQSCSSSRALIKSGSSSLILDSGGISSNSGGC